MRSWVENFLKDQGGGLKLLLIGFLTLALLIPLNMVEGVINERSWRHKEVLGDIARQHGGEQRLVGPYLLAPYVTESTITVPATKDQPARKRLVRGEGYAVILPEELKVKADLAHAMRVRGVYSAPVYGADVNVAGSFVTPDLQAVIPNLKSVQWAQAAVVLGLSDLTGLAAAGDLTIGEGKQAFQAGAPAFAGRMFGRIKHGGGYRGNTHPSGGDARFGAIHAGINFASRSEPGARMAFETTLNLKGSGGFFMAPAAKTSRLAVAGDWPHPSFQGAPLPESREVTEAGFTADWAVPALARGYGAVWHGDHAKILLADAVNGAIGFRHARPDDFYVGAERAVKYGVLFVALTFLACFVLERFGGRRLHPAQYGLVGLSLALFYLLLISLAERIGLAGAYVGAAAVIALMNGAYVGAALASFKSGAGAGGSLALLYAAFYVMLMSEDDALLIGSSLLLLGVALAMAATARIGKSRTAAPEPPQVGPASEELGESQ